MTPRRTSRQRILARRKRSRADLRRMVLLAFTAIILIPVISVPALAARTVGPLPQVGGLSASGLQQDTLIFDRHGSLLADIGLSGDHRIVVPLSYISPWLVKATLATEDRSFYKNNGIDVVGIVRAAFADYSSRRITQGGSTISQQLVKQVFIGANPPNTLQRKLKEAALALELNRRYSKDQILEMYLNTIYYGEQTYGVEAAARGYFQSNAHDLTLGQAAILAGLPQAPSSNDPLRNPAQAKARQAQVLDAMVAEKYITRAQAQAAYDEKLQVYPPINKFQAPYFVDYVLKYLDQNFHLQPSDRKGYRITTSLDLPLQLMAEQVVRQQIAQKGSYYNFHDAALVAMDPKTGEVLAMVGGNDYNKPGGQINMAYDAPRQPGSSFKIFTYTAAIESRSVNMVSPILDEPLKFPLGGGLFGNQPYVPQNYDFKFHGTQPLKLAMGNSLNIPALKVELRTGIPAVVDVASRMGITCLGGQKPCTVLPPSRYTMSLTLGSYPVRVADMATAASTLATLGVRHREAPVLSIKDGLGKAVYNYDPQRNAYRALAPQVAYVIASIMSDDRNRCMEFGCGGDLTLAGRHVAAKTGTTNDFRDNWTVGFTPTLATAVWVGNPDNKPLSHNSTGIVGAAPIWHRFMTNALKGVPDHWYDTPSGITRSGDNVFISGTENLAPTLNQKWPVCKFKTYNPYTVTAADLTVDGVPCVLPQPEKKPPEPNPNEQQTTCPPRLDRRLICILPSPSPSP